MSLQFEDDDPEIEFLAPPAAAEAQPTALAETASVDVLPPAVPDGRPTLERLTQTLTDFPLATLLMFLPDVTVKRRIEALASVALAVEVKGAAGVEAADQAVTELRRELKGGELLFDGTEKAPGPTALAYTLHRRLTGLREDFLAVGRAAEKSVARRILDETRAIEAEAREEQRRRQAEADRQAREAANRAAVQAEERQASPAVVAALRDQGKTATAPPVTSTVAKPKLTGSTTVENWKTRFKGTSAEADTHPESSKFNAAQLEGFRTLLQAILQGHVPVAAVQVDWAYLDRRAKAEKTSFDIPGIEAYDEGGLRAKRK